MTTSARSESIANALKLCLPGGFERIFDHWLKTTIYHDRHSERSAFIVLFRDVHSSCWFGFPEGIIRKSIDHFSSCCWRFDHQLVHPRRVFPCIHLGDTPYTDEPIRVTFQHEFLERADLFQIPLLSCRKHPVSQVTNSPIGGFPVDGIPVGLLLGSVCRE